MTDRSPWLGLVALALVAAVGLGAGTVLGVGPLAPSIPPQDVTDPGEMLARSLQATIDASAVHLEGTATGSIPGRLVDRPEATVSLAGTVFDADIRPRDGKTRMHVSSPGLDVELDTVTAWDGAWYRLDDDDPWQRASLGDASSDAGIDINPLTLVDRLRAFLATPGMRPTAVDVPCVSDSGGCHEVHLDAGSDPAMILALLLPRERADLLPPVDVDVTLTTDALTLRPLRLIVHAASADGSVDIRAELASSRWDEDLVVEEPVVAE